MALWFIVVRIILLSVAFCLHIIGITCLLKHTPKNKNQKVILLSLSITEISIIIINVCSEVFHFVEHRNLHNTNSSVYFFFLTWFVTSFCMVMIVLVVDRLLCVVSHLKYRYYVTPKKLLSTIVGLWTICAFPSIPHLLYNQTDPEMALYTKIFLPALSCFYTLLAIFVYVVIGYKLYRREKVLSRNRESQKSFLRKKQTLIPLCIIVSFILLVLTPEFVTIWTVDNVDNITDSGNIEMVLAFLWYSGFIVDPVIYVFLNQSLRNIAVEMFCCNRSIDEMTSGQRTEKKNKSPR